MKYLLIALLIIPPFLLKAQYTYAYESGDEWIASNAPRELGMTYRIEVGTFKYFNRSDPAVKKLIELAPLYSEFIFQNSRYRLNVGDYFSKSEAQDLKDLLRKEGFKDAKIVVYHDGYRSNN